MKPHRLILTIMHDDCPESPREWDNLGTMYCEHRRYSLGDKNDTHPEQVKDIAVKLPIYGYDHGGLTISTSPFSCPWDSGLLGIIYITRTKILKEYGWKKLTKERIAKIESYLKSEVEVYDHYLTGETYGYTLHEVSMIETGDGEEEYEEEVDSCWGFYGWDYKTNGILDNLYTKYKDLPMEVVRK